MKRRWVCASRPAISGVEVVVLPVEPGRDRGDRRARRVREDELAQDVLHPGGARLVGGRDHHVAGARPVAVPVAAVEDVADVGCGCGWAGRSWRFSELVARTRAGRSGQVQPVGDDAQDRRRRRRGPCPRCRCRTPGSVGSRSPRTCGGAAGMNGVVWIASVGARRRRAAAMQASVERAAEAAAAHLRPHGELAEARPVRRQAEALAAGVGIEEHAAGDAARRPRRRGPRRRASDRRGGAGRRGRRRTPAGTSADTRHRRRPRRPRSRDWAAARRSRRLPAPVMPGRQRRVRGRRRGAGR